MIAKITRGKNTASLLGYLYGPGRANEHTDPHLVASWDGFAPDPGRTDDFTATKKQLVNALNLRVHQAGDRAPEQHVWHCSLRAAPEDRVLSDEDWADIARRIVHATGIAPNGDPDGCRWAAVRHADDHIHIAATTVRGDLRPARHWNDYLTVDRELAAIEKDYGLRQVARGDRTAAQRPTRAEKEKSRRTGHQDTARERLRTIVRTALSAATSTEEFIGLLTDTDGILIEVQHFPSGDIRGYKVALDDNTNATGQPVWFSGSKLAPDLSLPKIHERLNVGNDTSGHRGRSSRNPWHEATAATEQIPERLDQGDDSAAQAHLAALGEALNALPLIAPPPLRAHLRQAATAFERATRSRIRAEHHHARALRSAMRTLLREPAPTGDGAGLAMLLDAAILAVIAATRWHQLRQHDQQVAAAHQARLHLQTAYDQAAEAPLAALASRRPPQQTVDRQVSQIRQAVPGHAEQVLADPACDALTTVLTDAEAAGHDPAQLLQQAADQRALNDAHSPARVLTWRIQRLDERHAPSPRTHAAQARSTTARPTTKATEQTVPVAIPPMPRPYHSR